MQQKESPSFTDLFLSFFWIGLTAYGGMAMSAHIRKQIADKRGWMDGKSFDAGLALCQVIPGAIVMQLVAYIGLKLKGVRGALISFVSFGFPAFLILMGIIPFFDKLRSFPQFNKVINGILCSFVGLLAVVTYRFAIGIHWDITNILLTLVAFVLLIRKVDVIWVIISGVLFSILI